MFDGGDVLQRKLRTSIYLGLAQTIMYVTLVHQATSYRISNRTTELYMQWGMLYAITPLI